MKLSCLRAFIVPLRDVTARDVIESGRCVDRPARLVRLVAEVAGVWTPICSNSGIGRLNAVLHQVAVACQPTAMGNLLYIASETLMLTIVKIHMTPYGFRQTCKRRSQIPLNRTLTIALTLMITVSGNPNPTYRTYPTNPTTTGHVLFNMVQEFGTAVYRYARFS